MLTNKQVLFRGINAYKDGLNNDYFHSMAEATVGEVDVLRRRARIHTFIGLLANGETVRHSISAWF